MKQDQNKIILFFSAFSLLLIILDSATAANAAREAIDLCIEVLIPSLFPFIFLSSVLIDCLSNHQPGLKSFSRLCRIPHGAESIWLIGLLGGYPVGAQCIGQAYSTGRLSKKDASRMLGFCNNCGPAFIFGVLSGMFPNKWMIWALWIIHILSSFFTACVLPGHAARDFTETRQSVSVVNSLKRCVSVMSQLCGWVILYRILIAFIDRWFGFILTPFLQSTLYGFCEMTNGCILLTNIDNISHRFILCSAMIAWGGLCVAMQTWCVLPAQINKQMYFLGKTIQTLFSIALSSLMFISDVDWIMTILSILALIVVLFFLRKIKIKHRNLEAGIV